MVPSRGRPEVAWACARLGVPPEAWAALSAERLEHAADRDAAAVAWALAHARATAQRRAVRWVELRARQDATESCKATRLRPRERCFGPQDCFETFSARNAFESLKVLMSATVL